MVNAVAMAIVKAVVKDIAKAIVKAIATSSVTANTGTKAKEEVEVEKDTPIEEVVLRTFRSRDLIIYYSRRATNYVYLR